MKLRYIYIVSGILATLLLSGCASLYIKNGKQAFDDLRYQDAIWYLERGTDKKEDAEAKKMLAESYLMVDNYEKASELYSEVSIATGNTDTDRINQGMSLMSVGRYPEARTIFEGIVSRDPSNEVAQSLLRSCKKLDELKSDSLMYLLTPLDIPGVNNAFSATPFNGGLIVTSTKSLGSDTDPYTNSAFTDLYFTKNNSGTWSNAQPLTTINGKFHDAAAVVSPNGQTLVYTRSFSLSKNALSTNDQDESPTQLYMSKRESNGDWGAPELVPFCDIKNNYAHPSFSADGSTLYFASDLNGGQGGMDLWESKSTGGVWGTPRNLGAEINTKGNELFPTARGNDSLYFSSDSHVTLGGLDILYSVKKDGATWPAPNHMSYPINSNRDDFGIVWTSADGGYLSSDRTGSDKIYSFMADKPEVNVKMLVTGKDSNLPLGGTEVIVVNVTEGTEKSYFTDGNGMLEFPLEPGKDYKVKTQLEGYFNQVEDITTKGITADKTFEKVVELQEVYITKDEPIVKDEPIIKDNTPKETKGNYNVPNIHWDYNKWDIRPDAEPYLNDVASLFKNNAKLKFEMRSHTDCRGSQAYNDDLSAKRAKAVSDYLVAKGVSRSHLTSKGFGEKELLNECTDNVQCPEPKHEQNRRTEFIVKEK